MRPTKAYKLTTTTKIPPKESDSSVDNSISQNNNNNNGVNKDNNGVNNNFGEKKQQKLTNKSIHESRTLTLSLRCELLSDRFSGSQLWTKSKERKIIFFCLIAFLPRLLHLASGKKETAKWLICLDWKYVDADYTVVVIVPYLFLLPFSLMKSHWNRRRNHCFHFPRFFFLNVVRQVEQEQIWHNYYNGVICINILFIFV